MPDLPNFHEWQQPAGMVQPEEIAQLYERGFAGALHSDAEVERFRAEMPNPSGSEVCHRFGFAGSAAGKLVATWVVVEKIYPGCWPASAQQRGDCVSHAQRNAMLTTLVGEVVAGLPDAVSGKTESAPVVSPEGIKHGVLATEALYRHRGSKGDGWYCAAAARVAVQETGAVIRRDYPGQADLTKYNPDWAGGSARPSELDTFDDNRFREATELDSFEAIRDLLDRGFGVTSCGSEGFAKTRDANGVSRKSGSWAHAMAYIGADDRPKTRDTYGGPLVLVLNSWGPRWNSGPRTVRGTSLDIPEGSFWARWSDLRKRTVFSMAGLNGWARQSLPDYSPGFGQ